MSQKFFKVIACEIAYREICYVAAQSRHLTDLEFLTQGLHDHPCQGCHTVQERIDAVPAGKYDAILLGYSLCGNLITGLRASHTPLVIPRAHDCITWFVGSHERYLRLADAHTGCYYYTSGWLECLRRRGLATPKDGAPLLPTRGGFSSNTRTAYEEWVQKYGEERARYLAEVMEQWTENYTHGVLIDFDFTRQLHLREQVQQICQDRGWQFEQIDGDLHLLQRWLDGEWDEDQFLVVKPGTKVMPSYKENIICTEPATEN